jgi:hypothetical protein
MSANAAKRDEVLRMATDAARAPLEIDLERRVVRGAIGTDGIADDGAVILLAGVDFSRYLQNPVVCARHARAGMAQDGGGDARPQVIGRCLGIAVAGGEIVAETQFADTPLGAEWGWLYGINPAREVYMRAWSMRAEIVESETWGMDRLRRHLGTRFDEGRLPSDVRRTRTALAVLRSDFLEYSCVEIGGDRAALTRAHGDGCALAGELVLRMDLTEARAALAAQGREMDVLRERVRGIEELVRGRDGRAAATPNDTALILDRLHSLREQMRSLAA